MDAAPHPAKASAAALPFWRRSVPLKLWLKAADICSVTALLLIWLWHSWMRWGDPLIDFPRMLYAAWRLSEGDLLYQDVDGQYGPLAYLVSGAGFRIFGVGLNTIVWMDIVIMLGVILLLRAIFRKLGGRFMAWLASMIFISLFAFNNFYLMGNYNFITPYSLQATYAFAGLLVMLWALLNHQSAGHWRWWVVAGVGFAIVYLDKPDVLLAALGTLAVYLALQFLHQARTFDRSRNWLWFRQMFLGLAAGFLLVWLPVLAYFFYQGGWSYALYATNHEIFTLTNTRVIKNIQISPMMLRFSGFDDAWANFIEEFVTGAVLAIGSVVIICTGRQWSRMQSRTKGWLIWFLLAMIPVGVALYVFPQVGLWIDSGEAFVFPVAGAAVFFITRCAYLAWRGESGFDAALALAVVGTAASLMLTRVILNAQIPHFGFFMMPLAICYWISLVISLSVSPAPDRQRVNWLSPAAVLTILILGTIHLNLISWGQYSLRTYAVGEGRDRFYTYPPSILMSGWQLDSMIRVCRQVVPNAKLVAVLPGGIAVNYHLRIRTPFKKMEVFPIAVTAADSLRVLGSLMEHPPDAVLLYSRDLSENGAFFFGADKASGRNVIDWLKQHYYIAAYAGRSPSSATLHAMDLLLPKTVPPPPERVIVTKRE